MREKRMTLAEKEEKFGKRPKTAKSSYARKRERKSEEPAAKEAAQDKPHWPDGTEMGQKLALAHVIDDLPREKENAG